MDERRTVTGADSSAAASSSPKPLLSLATPAVESRSPSEALLFARLLSSVVDPAFDFSPVCCLLPLFIFCCLLPPYPDTPYMRPFEFTLSCIHLAADRHLNHLSTTLVLDLIPRR
ncbi:uncharacterized protein BO80DRAFT_185595 [Aspergillus ibericus CBS 121593]|uniref:Uncharacterized protein n=1 Tax=Aspergillus ibericus CBS 121593 TaxID=1448316 RepID=A0A395GQG6_9EURO|nr:hypothetical protein BO80DRAFT_185595 [Aspergillus ibericus CBS 121593]RAK97755.1 hypothetical protein BO80DRAFT_185595 [Aspergillus ibericus CBS 121593]